MSDERPSLGELAQRLRQANSAPPEHARSGSAFREADGPAAPVPPGGPRTEPLTARALGAGLGILATFLAAIAFAFALSRLVGGTYVTFAMPLIVGTLIAALGSYGPRRFSFAEPRPLVLMMVLGALVCWLGQHLFAYLRVADLVAAQLGVSGPDAAAAGLAEMERATGESGFFAYLGFVSSGPGATLSPIGYLGRLELGAVGTALVALAELGLMALAGSLSLLYRTRALRRPPGGPVAFFDDAAARAALGALQARRFDELAAIARTSTAPPSHALVLTEGDATAEAALYELDRSGQPAQRTLVKLMPIEAARRLRAALSHAPAATREGDPDGPRDA